MALCMLDPVSFGIGVLVTIFVPIIFYKVVVNSLEEHKKWVAGIVTLMVFVILLTIIIVLAQVCGSPFTMVE